MSGPKVKQDTALPPQPDPEGAFSGHLGREDTVLSDEGIPEPRAGGSKEELRFEGARTGVALLHGHPPPAQLTENTVPPTNRLVAAAALDEAGAPKDLADRLAVGPRAQAGQQQFQYPVTHPPFAPRRPRSPPRPRRGMHSHDFSTRTA